MKKMFITALIVVVPLIVVPSSSKPNNADEPMTTKRVLGEGKIILGDMTGSKLPPSLEYNISFKDASGDGILAAEENAEVIVSIANKGKGIANNVSIKADTNTPGLISEPVIIPFIRENEVIDRTMHIKTFENLPSTETKINIIVEEGRGFSPPIKGIVVRTQKYLQPKLIANNLSSDMSIKPAEIKEVAFRITNTGEGTAQDVVAELVLGTDVFLGGEQIKSFPLGSINSGAHKDILFMLYTNSKLQDGENVPVTVNVYEKKKLYGVSTAVGLIADNPNKGVSYSNIETVSVKKEIDSDVDTDIPLAITKADKHDVAVVIGNSRYQYVHDVDYAINDASTVKNYLIKTFGFDDKQIIYIENASLGKFYEIFGSEKKAKGKLANYVVQDVSRVYIYYSGHGSPDLESKDAFIVPVDANINYIATSGYPLQVFYDNIGKLRAKDTTIILDACFSGTTEKGMLFKDISPALIKVKQEYQKPSNTTLFASSGFAEVSTWYPEKRHGMFTYWFLKGLQGEADLDNNKSITIGEIKKYLADNVSYEARKLHGIEQNPVIDGKLENVLRRIK